VTGAREDRSFNVTSRTRVTPMCLDSNCEPRGPDRRDFLAGAGAALAALAADGARTAAQDKRPPTRVLDDPNITHGLVKLKSGGKEIGGYLARPKADGKHPAVLVVAGNKISEEYIPNTCAALAVAGYVGLAPEIFHVIPENARTQAEVEKALAGHTDEHFLKDIKAGADYLAGHEAVRPGPMGILGFCSGGRRAMLYAARYEGVGAVVPFHPAKTTAAEVAKLTAPVQIHTGTADRVVPVADVRELERLLKAQKTPVELFVYEGADHGFLAYTRPFYKPEDAKLAWERTVRFLGTHLKK
jgi:carboxymethylenebutenolidase